MGLLPSTTYGCVIAILILMLALLQVLHMMLLSQLEDKRSLRLQQKQTPVNHIESNALLSAVSQRLASHRILDSSGEYQIISNVFSQEIHGKSRLEDVTLVSQCSLHLIHHLPALIEAWRGPISVSVFLVDSQLPSAVEMLLYVHRCVPLFDGQVAVHFVLPLSHKKLSVSISSLPSMDCNKLSEILQKSTTDTDNYALGSVPYPNNLLRNVALQNAFTEHHLVIDIDILPSPQLRQHFTHFIKLQSSNETAYVLPVFELSLGAVFPQTKQHLLDLWDQGSIRPFYMDACWKCQRFTDYDSWRKLPASDRLSTAYEVEWKDPWEPFFIASWQAPRYDERFKQYGFNRISQVCEMHIRGCRFVVLQEAYLIHHGFKLKTSFHTSKSNEQEKNRLLFRQFKNELKTKYPDTERRCY